MRAAKVGYIVMSALFCVLGAVLLIWPDVSVRWIGRLLGIGMLIFGAVKLVGYFSRDLFRLAFQYDLAFVLSDFKLAVFNTIRLLVAHDLHRTQRPTQI